jgi:hypothetical protein
MTHPNLWPDIIIGVLIGEGFLISIRALLHYISRRNRNQQIAARVEAMRPAALDNYRAAVKEHVRAPLG